MVSDYGVQCEGGVHSPCLPHDHLLVYSTISKMINLSAFVSPWHLCQESADHAHVGLLWAIILFARFECLHLPHFTVPAGTSRNQIARVLYVIPSILGPLHLCLHFKIRLFISTLHKLGVTLTGTVLTLWITLRAAGHSLGSPNMPAELTVPLTFLHSAQSSCCQCGTCTPFC